MPFDLYQRHLVVTKGSIGGLKGLNLLIDTGTIPSVVDSQIARKLHLQTESALLVAFGQQMAIHSTVFDGFRIGSLQSGPVPASVGDLSYLAGIRIDAIVGLDVLARTSFSIDYRTRVLRFAPEGREESVAPLELAWPFVTVRMAVADEEMRLSSIPAVPTSCCSRRGCPPRSRRRRGKATKQCGTASGAARLLRLDLRKVGLGTHTWDRLPAWALDRSLNGYPASIDGVLGVVTLGCRRVRFDFDEGNSAGPGEKRLPHRRDS